jgi:PAS domain S-box-containing protein
MTAPTILVVEDNPITRKMLRVVLETEGYAVVEAPDARAALTAVQAALPDLVVQDLILPDMDGLELVRRLRALAGGPELPILALSGFLSRFEEIRTADPGFTALLVKPIEPSRLVESIRAYLPEWRETPVLIGKGQRLLVVDDDPVQLKLARIHFTHLGFAVTAAGSASDALRAAHAKRPDVVLSDVFMPEIDGFQLCLEFRRTPSLAQVPVVLVSGQYGSEADKDLARRVGANALVLRTPDFGEVVPALVDALEARAPSAAEAPSDALKLKHAGLVIHQLERQVAATSGLTQRCAFQAAQLSLLSGVADALTHKANVEATLRDILAATLDAAGISKGAWILRDDAGALRLRQDIGFSDAERTGLQGFFGHLALFENIVERAASVSVPSSEIPESASRDILAGANVASAQIVPLVSDGRGMGAMIIAAARTDVTSEDSIAFARAMGNQVVQSLQLTDVVARLAASEKRYRTLLHNASDAIATLTPDGVLQTLNRRWEEILGRPEAELVGRHIREFVPPGPEGDNVQAYHEALTAKSDRTPPVPITKADGTIAWMEFSATAVDIAGEPVIFAIGRDVTEQRTLEEQLRQAQKLEAIGQLAGGVAHDFNNVLTAMLGFTELLLAGLPPDDPGRGDLAEIKKAGERAAGLTRQLLAFSRKQILQPKVLDINGLITGMEPMLRRLIFEHVDLVVSLKPNIGLINIDPTQLEQILVNLAVNAADAMPRGGKLTIETANVTLDANYQQRHLPVRPGDYIMLAVSDTGVGMDEATSRRIFEPFFTTKEVGKGTGLGLATVYGIVKQSGGDIWVYSEPGRGTTFKIYLPQTTAGVPSSVERSTDVGAVRRGSETILLVEDDEGVRLLARVTLERTGYHVLHAGSPKEAVRIAAEAAGPIHLLLSDVIMPDSEGPPLFDRLAKVQPDLRVLYMSGYADEAIVRHGVLVEGTPFLQKPFTPHALARKVRDVLDAPPPASPV